MSVITQALYNKLASDPTLVGMLPSYNGEPNIFTADPAPGDATPPYIVTAGEVSQAPWDTKTTLGRQIIRDVRCYDEATGSAQRIESIAERVRFLLHRQALTIGGFTWVISDCNGPIVADEPGYYGRILSLSLWAQEV